MPAQDQVVWAEVNVMVGDGLTNFKRDALLPAPVTDAEVSFRQTLRLLGAVHLAEVVYMPGEPGYVPPAAEEAASNGTPPAAAAEADTASAETAAAGPVIVGAEDPAAETEAHAKGAASRARPAAKS